MSECAGLVGSKAVAGLASFPGRMELRRSAAITGNPTYTLLPMTWGWVECFLEGMKDIK